MNRFSKLLLCLVLPDLWLAVCQGQSQSEPSSIWANLVSKQNTLLNFFYKNRRLSVWKDNVTQVGRVQFFITSVPRLNPASLDCQKSFLKDGTQLVFFLELWSHSIQDAAIRAINQHLGVRPTRFEVKPLPFEKIRLVQRSAFGMDKTSMVLDPSWLPNTQEPFGHNFYFWGENMERCLNVKEEIVENPEGFVMELKLEGLLSTNTHSFQVGVKDLNEQEVTTEEGESLREMLETLNGKIEMAMKMFSSTISNAPSCRRDIAKSAGVAGIEYELEQLWIPAGGRATITCVQLECHVRIPKVSAVCAGGEWDYHPCKTNCSILLIGGQDSLGSVEWFNPWVPSENQVLETRLFTPRRGHISAVLDNGRVLIAGGWNGSQYLSSMELLDAKQEALTQGPSLSNKRYLAAAAAAYGSVFVCGGGYVIGGVDDRGPEGHQRWRSCERFRAGAWTPIASMSNVRQELTMVALAGKLYAIGGYNGTSALSVMETYDIQTDTWTTKSPMLTARQGLGAAVWGQSIVVCGGFNREPLKVCEKYDVEMDRWTAISPMKKERFGFTLTTLGDWVVAVGGRGEGIGDSAELYDPTEDHWTLLDYPKLAHKRYWHSAVF